MVDEWKARPDRPVTVPLLHVRLAEQVERLRGERLSADPGRCRLRRLQAMPGFRIGDHVSWNSEAGRVNGTIRRKVIAPMRFKGYTVRASKEEPQYLIKSDRTDHLAMHKVSALRKLRKRRQGS